MRTDVRTFQKGAFRLGSVRCRSPTLLLKLADVTCHSGVRPDAARSGSQPTDEGARRCSPNRRTGGTPTERPASPCCPIRGRRAVPTTRPRPANTTVQLFQPACGRIAESQRDDYRCEPSECQEHEIDWTATNPSRRIEYAVNTVPAADSNTNIPPRATRA